MIRTVKLKITFKIFTEHWHHTTIDHSYLLFDIQKQVKLNELTMDHTYQWQIQSMHSEQ